MQTASLTLTRSQHDELLAHLFSPDGCEAVAIALCGLRHGNDRLRLLMQEITPIPYEACSDRQPHRVTWPTHILPPLLEKARRRGLAVLKIHGHGRESPFSTIDDHADRALFPSVHAWTDGDPHGSAIAYPDGRMRRSTTAAALAWHLARKGERVLVVDLDLESPGLASALFEPERCPTFGMTDWFVEDLVGQGDQVLDDMTAARPGR